MKEKQELFEIFWLETKKFLKFPIGFAESEVTMH